MSSSLAQPAPCAGNSLSMKWGCGSKKTRCTPVTLDCAVRQPILPFAQPFTPSPSAPTSTSQQPPRRWGRLFQLISQMTMLRVPKVTGMVGCQAEILYQTPGSQPQALSTAPAAALKSSVSGVWGKKVTNMWPGVSSHPSLAGSHPLDSPVCCARYTEDRS